MVVCYENFNNNAYIYSTELFLINNFKKDLTLESQLVILHVKIKSANS